MALPTSKETFIDYCLRKLGSPVIQINLSTDQIDDAYEEAIRYFHENHMDGSERMIHPMVITEDLQNTKKVILDENIYSINEIMMVPAIGGGGQLFNYEYQMTSDLIWNTMKEGGGFYDYALMKNQLAEIRFQVVGSTGYNFNYHTGRLSIDLASYKLIPGQYLILDVMKFVDPEEFPLIHKSTWLQKYATALIKMRWGAGLQKFQGVALPGGVQLNGSEIYSQAVTEKQALEEECDSRYNLPMQMFVG